MELRNCRRCGFLFRFKGYYVCPRCQTLDERDFEVVKEYLRSHPRASTVEVSKDTGVDASVVNRFLREGRLKADGYEVEDGMLSCDACGAPISQGRYCEKCLANLQQELRKASSELRQSQEGNTGSKGKVHTMKSIKKKY